MPLSGPQSGSSQVSLGAATGTLVTTTVTLTAATASQIVSANANYRYVFIQNNTAAGSGVPNVTVSNVSTLTAGAGIQLAPGGSSYEWAETTPPPAAALYAISPSAGTLTVMTMT